MTTVSIKFPSDLLHLLDQHVRVGNFPSRSEAIAEAVREWSTRKMQAGYALLDPEDTKVWDVTLTDGLDDDAPRGD
jgi:Ribbon-helix-helix protein, copG family.